MFVGYENDQKMYLFLITMIVDLTYVDVMSSS